MIQFTPLRATTFIRDVIRDWFQVNSKEFPWNPDPKVNKIVINSADDYNSKEAKQKFPRILIKRGQYQGGVQFIDNSMETKDTGPSQQVKSRLDFNGMISLIVEANNEGTCEVIAENLRVMFLRNRILIEKTFGFQRFGWQISVSSCDPQTEDKEKFKIEIQLPYIVEDYWSTTPDSVLLKGILGEVIIKRN